MIRVTKCPHCQTLFKVTDDQLKLYNGAVRCGVCQQIFNGANYLQAESPAEKDIPLADGGKTLQLPEALPPFSEPSPSEKDRQPLAASLPPEPDTEDEITLSLAEEDINAPPENAALFDTLEEEISALSLELGQAAKQLSPRELPKKPEKKEPRRPPAASVPSEPRAEPSPEKTLTPVFPAKRLADLSLYAASEETGTGAVQSFAPRLEDDAATVTLSSYAKDRAAPADTPASTPLPGQPSRSRPQQEDADPLMDPAYTVPAGKPKVEETTTSRLPKEPDFVKKGRRKKQRSLFSTILFGALTLILFGILAIQCLYLFSDRMTVWWPPAEPAITKACHLFACPRRLETRISAFSIESSELQAIPDLKDKYALSLLLRNSSSSYQSWPHVELTLTDPDKQPTVRKVLAPADYLPDASYITRGIPPYAEESVKLYLQIKTELNTDYRISLFYP
ncbi:MAG: DUF3426 domain-containing protein [Alistipes senegalensis]|nr:DUF3426 domain-containing protein [Oxalobacter formigenes]MCM1280652.1 DUF3426 domain-containing protein [Alistipes senegalensis]